MSRRALLAGLACAGLSGCSTGSGEPAETSETPEPAELVRRCTFGAWAAGPEGLAGNHFALETLLGARLPLVSWYADWNLTWDGAFAAEATRLTSRGSYELLISWEPVGVDLAGIVDGAHDAYLTEFLRGAASFPGPVTLRPFPEMNGAYQPWSLDHPEALAPDAGTWIAAWCHVVRLGREIGRPNLSFLFCANATDEGSAQGTTPMESYWPGVEWVDAVGIDGYTWNNTGDDASGGPESSFEQVITPMYERLLALHPEAAVTVCETGCVESPGKADWFTDLYTSRRFPALQRIAFFHENKERDWRLDSDTRTLAVNQRFLAGPARS